MKPNHENRASIILGLLEGVRRCGNGWIAKCPSHEDRAASLSVAIGRDGRILLNCFGGCQSLGVVHALGLEVSDLFEKRITKDMSPAEKSELQEQAMRSGWKAALAELDYQANLLLIIARDMYRGNRVDADLLQKTGLAIADSRAKLSVGPASPRTQKWRPKHEH